MVFNDDDDDDDEYHDYHDDHDDHDKFQATGHGDKPWWHISFVSNADRH